MVRTVVTREAEWDDMERAKMLALVEYERGLCACGLPKHIADENPDIPFDHRVCPVCADLAEFARRQHAADEAWVKESERALGRALLPEEKRPQDGRHLVVASGRGLQDQVHDEGSNR